MRQTGRKMISIIIAAAVFVPAFLLSGCSDDSALRQTEDTNIQKFLSEAKLTEDDYTFIEGVYRIITGNTFDDSGDGESDTPPYDPPTIKDGDSIEFLFALYLFSGADPTSSAPLYTNILGLMDANTNTEYWPDGPVAVTVGNGEVMKGIDVALQGCRLGDSVILLIPSRMAYGKDQIGIVGKDKMLYCRLFLTGVNGEYVETGN